MDLVFLQAPRLRISVADPSRTEQDEYLGEVGWRVGDKVPL